MKTLQTTVFKISVSAISLLFSVPFFAVSSPELTQAPPDEAAMSAEALAKPNSAQATLGEADSLFRLKQYTQSLELYQSLFDRKIYSPSMLLKMAYIQEGLGRIGPSVYYLNLYALTTTDQQVINKIEDVAKKNHLEGYNESDTSQLVIFLTENTRSVQSVLAALCVFCFAVMFAQKRSRNRVPVLTFMTLVALCSLLFATTQLKSTTSGIVASPSTYLMEGPSAASPVVSLVGEGHKLRILGKKDVWVKVQWSDRVAYIKGNQLLSLEI
jgi:hypothetical protein